MAFQVSQFMSAVSAGGGLARTNNFNVMLPRVGSYDQRQFNVLVKETQLPGRQIVSNESKIGQHLSKIAYGYAVTDLNISFNLANDYLLKDYFYEWQELAVNQETYEVGYFNDYALMIQLQQLGTSGARGARPYGVQLINAYPTTITGVALNNNENEIQELNVTFSYKNWKTM